MSDATPLLLSSMQKPKKRSVRRPYERVTANVACQSFRGGTKPRVIVLHDTESHDRQGISDLVGLVSFFDRPSTQASAHVIVDGQGYSAKCVDDDKKAWHCKDFNSIALGIEQIGFATFTAAMWNKHKRAQLKKVAKYIAYWSKKYDIPIKKARTGVGGHVYSAGVTTHSALGSSGGGHHDPGKGYPFDAVLRMARYYRRRGWK